MCIGVWAPSELRGGDLIAQKNITLCPKAWVLFKRTQIVVKTKTFKILTSNETVIIPKIVLLKPRILYDLDQ